LVVQRQKRALPLAGLGQIAVLAVDSSSGIPTPVAGSPFATIFGRRTFVVLHPTKNFVYSNTFTAKVGSTISVLQIDPNTGVLVSFSEASSGGLGFDSGYTSPVRIEPTGRFLYVGMEGGSIAGYAIDQTTGALTRVPGLPLTTDAEALVTLDPSGRYLYSIGSGTGTHTIASYAIDRTSGALTLVNKLATGTRPVMVEVAGRQ